MFFIFSYTWTLAECKIFFGNTLSDLVCICILNYMLVWILKIHYAKRANAQWAVKILPSRDWTRRHIPPIPPPPPIHHNRFPHGMQYIRRRRQNGAARKHKREIERVCTWCVHRIRAQASCVERFNLFSRFGRLYYRLELNSREFITNKCVYLREHRTETRRQRRVYFAANLRVVRGSFGEVWVLPAILCKTAPQNAIAPGQNLLWLCVCLKFWIGGAALLAYVFRIQQWNVQTVC